jgi:hypothetical protein
MGGEFLAPEKVIAVASYANLPAASFASAHFAPNGMKPVAYNKPAADPQLGQLARDLAVDAVIVMGNNWSIQKLEEGRSPRAHMSSHIVIVGADGQRLWEEDEEVDGPEMDSGSAGSVGDAFKKAAIEASGALTPDQVQSMAKEAMNRLLARFDQKWKENKH